MWRSSSAVVTLPMPEEDARPVVTGPVEGAAIGNLLAQAMALGDIRDVDELRAVVRRSEPVDTYEPHHTPQWEAAYQKLLSFGK